MTRVRTLEHVADLRRRPATQRPVQHRVPASALGPLGTTAASVPADGEVELDAVGEATGADVVVTGVARFPWEGECRRCLQSVSGSVEAEVREIFEPTPVESETWPLDGDTIDLGPVLREVVLLMLPLVPLCSEDCVGPDPERFPATVEGEEPSIDAEGESDEAPKDPRWAALDQLDFD